jgi:hypothetical protein
MVPLRPISVFCATGNSAWPVAAKAAFMRSRIAGKMKAFLDVVISVHSVHVSEGTTNRAFPISRARSLTIGPEAGASMIVCNFPKKETATVSTDVPSTFKMIAFSAIVPAAC